MLILRRCWKRAKPTTLFCRPLNIPSEWKNSPIFKAMQNEPFVQHVSVPGFGFPFFPTSKNVWKRGLDAGLCPGTFASRSTSGGRTIYELKTSNDETMSEIESFQMEAAKANIQILQQVYCDFRALMNPSFWVSLLVWITSAINQTRWNSTFIYICILALPI